MFDFRIITCADGIQVIDPSVKTPYSVLTPVQMQEYCCYPFILTSNKSD